MGLYSKTNFGIRDLSLPNHWTDESKNFKITKPTILCFGGNGTTTPQAANGQAARNERLIGLKPKQNQVYGTYYHMDVISFYYGINSEHEIFGKMTLEESNNIINQLFLPLLIDQKTNKRLPIKEACKNFSLLIFSSFCYGSECVSSLMYDLQVKLLNYGYSRAEIFDIFSHSFHMSYSPLHQDSFLPFMQINSFEDSISKKFDLAEIFKEEYGYNLNGIKLDCTKKHFYKFIMDCMLRPNQKEIRVYTSQLVNIENNFGEKAINEHTTQYVDLDQNWGPKKSSRGARNSECVSKMAGVALAMAGARAIQIYENYKPLTPTNLEQIYDAVQSIHETYSEEELKSK